MNESYNRKLYRAARVVLRAVFSVVLFMSAYLYVIYFPPAIVAFALLYFIAAHRKRWKEGGGRSPAKIALLEMAAAMYVIATASIVVPPVYFAMLINRYVMGPIIAAAVISYIVFGVRKGNWIPVPLGLLALLSLSAAFITFLLTPNTEAANRRILRQLDCIKPIIMADRYSGELGFPDIGINPNNLTRMVSDPEEKYIYVTITGFSKRASGVLRVDAGDLKNQKLMKLPGCAGLKINSSGGVVYATGYYEGCIFVIKTPEMRLLKRIDVAKDLLQDIVLDEKIGYVLTNGEMKSKIYRVNLTAGLVEKEFRSPFPVMVDILKRNEVTGITYSRGDLMPSGFAEVDEKSGRLKKWKQLPMGMGFGFSPGGETVFLADSWFGYIVEMDLKSFRTLRRFMVRPGLRGIAIDSYRGLIYAGNYPDGYLDIIDIKSGELLATLYFGKKMRCMYLMPKSHRFFAISSYGMFEIDVDRALREAEKSARR